MNQTYQRLRVFFVARITPGSLGMWRVSVLLNPGGRQGRETVPVGEPKKNGRMAGFIGGEISHKFPIFLKKGTILPKIRLKPIATMKIAIGRQT
jgi:hypothetical protein